MRISDWSSDVCSSDLAEDARFTGTLIYLDSNARSFERLYLSFEKRCITLKPWPHRSADFSVLGRTRRVFGAWNVWRTRRYIRASRSTRMLRMWWTRSEGSRVGKEGGRKCKSWG